MKDVPYDYANFYIDSVLKKIDLPQGSPEKILFEEAMADIRTIVGEVAAYANQFDKIMVTGRSRLLTRTLLQMYGVDPRKFIVLGRTDNVTLYKDKGGHGSDRGIDEEIIQKYQAFAFDQRQAAFGRHLAEEFVPERTTVLEQFLRGKGVSADESVCWVDDVAESGRKMGRIMALLAACAERGVIRDFGGAVFFSKQSIPFIDEETKQVRKKSNPYSHPEPAAVFSQQKIAEKFLVPSLHPTLATGSEELAAIIPRMKLIQEIFSSLEMVFAKLDPLEIKTEDRENAQTWGQRKELRRKIVTFLGHFLARTSF